MRAISAVIHPFDKKDGGGYGLWLAIHHSDRPIARLIKDLEERGMLDRTLVMIIASEFNRDMLIEGVPGSTARDQSRAKTDVLKEMKHYGLHRHFTGGSSVVMFGGV